MDLEKEYSPSQCSHRAINTHPDELINSFVQIHLDETKRVKKIYNTRLDVKYGDTERQAVDIYFKHEESNSPIFVYVHGGYWIELSKAESGICVAPLVERGFRVIVVGYDLCPSVTLGEIVKQMQTFLKCLLDYAVDTNAESIHLCGHSAGAYLLATLLEPNHLNYPNMNLIKDFFLISGIYDLRELRNTESGNPNNVLSLDENSAEILSPTLMELIRPAIDTKVHVICAEYDSCEFRKQSKEFFKKLESENFTPKYTELLGHDHFTIIEELRNDKSSIMGLILKEMGLK